LGYFLDDSGNFENFVKIWTRSPPNYYQNASKNTRKYGIILEKYYLCQSGAQKIRKILNPGPTKHLFLFYFSFGTLLLNEMVYIIVFEGH
jgi:hypothetical protein